MASPSDQRAIDGLEKTFKRLIKIKNFQRLDINLMLEQNEVPYASVIAKYIRKEFMESDNSRQLKWKRGAKIPTDFLEYHIATRIKNDSDPNKVKRTRRSKEQVQSEFVGEIAMVDQPLTTILNSIKKNAKNGYIRIDVDGILKKAKIGEYCVLGTCIRRDFLDFGKKKGHYKWKEGMQVPVNSEEYRIKAIQQYKQANKTKSRSNEKPNAVKNETSTVMLNVGNSFARELKLDLKAAILSTFQKSKARLVDEAMLASAEYGVTISVDELNKI
jgi:hypothetical protein